MRLSKSERTAKKKFFRLMGVKRKKDQRRITAELRAEGISFKRALTEKIIYRTETKQGWYWWMRSPFLPTRDFWQIFPGEYFKILPEVRAGGIL